MGSPSVSGCSEGAWSCRASRFWPYERPGWATRTAKVRASVKSPKARTVSMRPRRCKHQTIVTHTSSGRHRRERQKRGTGFAGHTPQQEQLLTLDVQVRSAFDHSGLPHKPYCVALQSSQCGFSLFLSAKCAWRKTGSGRKAFGWKTAGPG